MHCRSFPPDYFAARSRFREAVERLGWKLEAHAIPTRGPQGEELTIDVGRNPPNGTEPTIVVSSGLHGVEGFFGSAVQLALLERWRERGAPPGVRLVFLHALNPFGFAWLRRWDESNVDPNRNFLLDGEPYRGCPDGYARLDPLLNPRRPPSRWEPFRVKALAAIARHGMPALKQAVAAGQYEFPQGLFFGGQQASASNRIVREHLDSWLGPSAKVVHLDFHTGLGRWGTWKLLLDCPLSPQQQQRLVRWFGAGTFEENDPRTTAYTTRGGLGQWCVARNAQRDYLYLCSEFGTYGPLQVIAGLRAENQAHHYCQPGDSRTAAAKQMLQELFCPASADWRSRVVSDAMGLVEQAIAGIKQA